MSQDLQIGITLPVEHAATDNIAERFDNMLEIVRTVRDAGFDAVSAPQHYIAAPSQYLHCIPVLGRVAAESGDMALCTNIIELPLHHPIEVAEYLATLDVICGGRLVPGFGRGYREEEFQSFGVEPGTRLSRFLESLELIKRLWTEDDVSHDGRHFKLDGVTLGIKPLASTERPHPPIVIGASSDKMVERTARLADGLSLAGHSTIDGLARQSELYKNTLRALGKPPPTLLRVGLETYIGEQRERALREALPYAAKKYANYAGWGQDEFLPDDQSFDLPPELLADGRFVIGDASEVSDRLLEYIERIGMNILSLRMHWVGMPHRLVMASLDRFCTHVLPQLKRVRN